MTILKCIHNFDITDDELKESDLVKILQIYKKSKHNQLLAWARMCAMIGEPAAIKFDSRSLGQPAIQATKSLYKQGPEHLCLPNAGKTM